MGPGLSTHPSTGGSAMPVIDRTVLGEWLGNDDDGINALLAVFRDSVCAEQIRLGAVLADGDLGEFAKTAHRLRGAALAMGASSLADIAGTLNDAANGQDSATCWLGMTALDLQIRLMVAEIPVDHNEPPPIA